MSHGARSLVASTRQMLLAALQYRVNHVVWLFNSVLQAVIYLAVWRAVARAQGGSVGGYDAQSFVGYFLVLLVVRELTTSNLATRLSTRARNGMLATQLLAPVHPYISYAGHDFSYKLQTVWVLLPTSGVLYWLFEGSGSGSVATAAVALALLPLAIAVRFLADGLLATTGLWLVEIGGIRGVYLLLLTFLGGQFAPLDVLPRWLELTAKALPFYWSLGYPVEVAIGRAPLEYAWIGALVLAAWVVGLYAVLQPVWRRGVRAYEAVGQ